MFITWGDNSVSSCSSCSRAKGPGTSAGAFSMARSLSGEDQRGSSTGCQGVLWDPCMGPPELAALFITPPTAPSSISSLIRLMYGV